MPAGVGLLAPGVRLMPYGISKLLSALVGISALETPTCLNGGLCRGAISGEGAPGVLRRVWPSLAGVTPQGVMPDWSSVPGRP